MFRKCRALLGAKVRKGAGIYKNKCFVPPCSRSAEHFLGQKLEKVQASIKTNVLSPVFKKCRALLGARVRKGAGIYKNKCFVPAYSRSAGHLLGRELEKVQASIKANVLSPRVQEVQSTSWGESY